MSPALRRQLRGQRRLPDPDARHGLELPRNLATAGHAGRITFAAQARRIIAQASERAHMWSRWLSAGPIAAGPRARACVRASVLVSKVGPWRGLTTGLASLTRADPAAGRHGGGPGCRDMHRTRRRNASRCTSARQHGSTAVNLWGCRLGKQQHGTITPPVTGHESPREPESTSSRVRSQRIRGSEDSYQWQRLGTAPVAESECPAHRRIVLFCACVLFWTTRRPCNCWCWRWLVGRVSRMSRGLL